MVPPTVFLHAECPANALCPEHDPASHLLFHEGKFDECENRLREVLDKCPACPRALFQLIGCLGALRREDEADLLLERLLPVANNDSELSYLVRLKGKILEDCLGPKVAIDWHQQSAELERDAAALSQVAATAWKLRRKKTAIDLANEALDLESYDPVVIRRSVRILIWAGRTEAAKAHLLRLAKRDYEIPQYHLEIAVGLVQAGASRKGLAMARRLAKSHPESADVACITSGLFMEAGKLEEAERLLRRLRKLDPAGHGKYALLRLAAILGMQGKYEEMLLQAVEANRDYYDDDTRRLLKAAVSTVTAGFKSQEAALQKANAEIQRINEDHEVYKANVAGFDTTERGANLQFALREGEGWHIEFKERMPDQVRHLAHEIAALSSQTEGGTVFIGIRKDGKVVGVNDVNTETERDFWRIRVRNIATKTMKPPNPVTVYFNEHDGLSVVKIWVPEGSAPIYYVDDIAYIRNLEESRKAAPEEIEEYIARRSNRSRK